MGRGAHEEPLPPAEAARARYQSDLLHQAAHRYSQPSVLLIGHGCANDAARDLSPITPPRDTPRTDARAELDEALAGEVIEIELESILEADSMSRTRHPVLSAPLPFFQTHSDRSIQFCLHHRLHHEVEQGVTGVAIHCTTHPLSLKGVVVVEQSKTA
jgi:hypothetical protein